MNSGVIYKYIEVRKFQRSLVEELLHRAGHVSAGLLPARALQKQLFQMIQLHHRAGIAGLHVVQARVGDQYKLLPEVVENNDLVEEHEVHIRESFLVLCIQLKSGFTVFDIIIGKLPY